MLHSEGNSRGVFIGGEKRKGATMKGFKPVEDLSKENERGKIISTPADP